MVVSTPTAGTDPPTQPPAADVPVRAPGPRVAGGVVRQLLRSAVTLQAEDLLRTIGAMAIEQRDVRQWTALVERDVRDLSRLASIAVAAGAALPAGFDGGTPDPNAPGSVMEGLLASHEALMSVLRQLAERADEPAIRRVVADVLDHRAEEAAVLRGLGAGHGLPAMERLVHGALSKYS
ncbi:MAG: hypothetical protein IPG94_17570 [Kineosporiaceae bacterium]|nr:hypothetical protein [Kineosporiaceae bacterium]